MHNKASYYLTLPPSLLGQAVACQCGLCAFIQLGSAHTHVYDIQPGIASSKNSASFDMDNNHAKGFFLQDNHAHYSNNLV